MGLKNQQNIELGLIISLCGGCAAGSPSTQQAPDAVTAIAAPLSFDSCDEDQQEYIKQATTTAALFLLSAHSDLDAARNGGDTSRFERWFGPYSEESAEIVERRLNGVQEQLYDINYDCGCNLTQDVIDGGGTEDNTVAWSVQNDPDLQVHLCHPFFDGDFEELAVGGIIHELTHLGGTWDWTYRCPADKDESFDSVAAAKELVGTGFAESNALNLQYYALNWEEDQPSTWACDHHDDDTDSE